MKNSWWRKSFLTFSDKMNMLPRLNNPLEHVWVRKILRKSFATICQICSQRSPDFSFDSESHLNVMSSGSLRSKNLARYLVTRKKAKVTEIPLWNFKSTLLTYRKCPFHLPAAYTTMSSRNSQYTGHCCTCRTVGVQDIREALTFSSNFLVSTSGKSKFWSFGRKNHLNFEYYNWTKLSPREHSIWVIDVACKSDKLKRYQREKLDCIIFPQTKTNNQKFRSKNVLSGHRTD